MMTKKIASKSKCNLALDFWNQMSLWLSIQGQSLSGLSFLNLLIEPNCGTNLTQIVRFYRHVKHGLLQLHDVKQIQYKCVHTVSFSVRWQKIGIGHVDMTH